MATLWSSVPPVHGLMPSMSVAVLERYVFSKPYFDRHGLLVAMEGEQMVGFAHAGFGPNEMLSDILMDTGVICLVMVRDREDQETIRQRLIEMAEDYLRQRGATQVRAGCIDRRSPFYLGIYGGSDMAGILESDACNLQTLRQSGYEPLVRTRIYRRQIGRYKPKTDRRLVQNRRRYNVESEFDIRSASWWEACQFAQIDRLRFRVRPRTGGPPKGELTFWDMGPLAAAQGETALGLVDLFIDEESRRTGLASFLLSESVSEMQSTGVSVILAQADESNVAAQALFTQFQFDETAAGVSMVKYLT